MSRPDAIESFLPGANAPKVLEKLGSSSYCSLPSLGRFCCKCGGVRSDIKLLCCETMVHARCLYPWPCSSCVSCRRPVGAIEVLVPEQLTKNGEVIRITEASPKQRCGRWTKAELTFAQMVIDGFSKSMLPIKDGTRLGTFLCCLLQCTPARLSSKLRTGKKIYQYRQPPVTSQQLQEHELAQKRLSQQEDLLLQFLPPEEAAVAAKSLQTEWRLQFISLARTMGQQIANLPAWQKLLDERGGKDVSEPQAEESEPHTGRRAGYAGLGPGRDERRSEGAQRVQGHENDSLHGIASLMVRMAAARPRNFTVSHGMMTATSVNDLIAALRAGPVSECCLLARASNGAILFASAGLKNLLLRDDAGLLGKSLLDASGDIVQEADSLVIDLAFRESQRRVSELLSQLSNPSLPIHESDLLIVPLLLRLRRCDSQYATLQAKAFATCDFLLIHADLSDPLCNPQLASLCVSNQQAQGQAFNGNPASSFPVRTCITPSDRVKDGLHQDRTPSKAAAHRINSSGLDALSEAALQPRSGTIVHLWPQAQAAGVRESSPEQPQDGSQLEVLAITSIGPEMAPAQTSRGQGHAGMDVAAKPQQRIESSGASRKRPRYGSISSSKPGENQHGAPDLEEGTLSLGGWNDEGLDWCSGGSHIGCDGGLEDLGDVLSLSRAGSLTDAWAGCTDLCYAPPTTFEQTMRKFLAGLPFEAVDIWVPVRSSTSGTLSLQFGGGMAVRADLLQWTCYSQTFAFHEGQGMVGRVFLSKVPELRDNLFMIDNSVFLRRDGAITFGVEVSFGVPIIQDGTCFVLIFYGFSPTRATPEILDFIRTSTSSWRIQATCTPESRLITDGSNSSPQIYT